MTTLQQTEAKLRDLAGYRGQPSSDMALTGPECLALVEELTRLRVRVGQAAIQAVCDVAPGPEGREP